MGAKKITHLTFIDVETTALVGPRVKPYVDQIVEIAIARVDIQTRQIEAWYETLIRPEGQDQTTPVGDAYPCMVRDGGPVGYAWDLGKYHRDRGTFKDVTMEEWQAGKSLDLVLAEIQPLLHKATLAGNNPAFDRDHIMRDYMGHTHPAPELDYHLVDNASLGMPLVILGAADGVSLCNLRVWAGLPGEQAHRAGQDVRDSIALFWRIVDVMGAGIVWERNYQRQPGLRPQIYARECEGQGPSTVKRVEDMPRDTASENSMLSWEEAAVGTRNT